MKNKNNKNWGFTQTSIGAAGFTLIEVLVALVILSLGLLGTAGLHIKSQQFSRSAYLNTQATIMAHDLLERVRANPAGLKSGVFNLPTPTNHGSCYVLAGCSIQELAENDVYEWVENLQVSLPNGKGTICIDSTPDDGDGNAFACDGVGETYVVKIWWFNINQEIQRFLTTVTF